MLTLICDAFIQHISYQSCLLIFMLWDEIFFCMHVYDMSVYIYVCLYVCICLFWVCPMLTVNVVKVGSVLSYISTKLIEKWLAVGSTWYLHQVMMIGLILSWYCDSHSRILNLHIDGLVQDCGNSSALAMELLLSCAMPLHTLSIHLITYPC